MEAQRDAWAAEEEEAQWAEAMAEAEVEAQRDKWAEEEEEAQREAWAEAQRGAWAEEEEEEEEVATRWAEGGPIPSRARSPSTDAADSDSDELDGEAKLVVVSKEPPDEKWLVRWPPASGEEVGTFKWVDPREHFGADAVVAMRKAHGADAARAEKQLSERTNSKKGASSIAKEKCTDGGGAGVLFDLAREMILFEDALDERYVTRRNHTYLPRGHHACRVETTPTCRSRNHTYLPVVRMKLLRHCMKRGQRGSLPRGIQAWSLCAGT